MTEVWCLLANTVSNFQEEQKAYKSSIERSENEESELSEWDSRLRVSSRGYMLGYNDLQDPSVSILFRFLSKIGDGIMRMQIIKIEF